MRLERLKMPFHLLLFLGGALLDLLLSLPLLTLLYDGLLRLLLGLLNQTFNAMTLNTEKHEKVRAIVYLLLPLPPLLLRLLPLLGGLLPPLYGLLREVISR